MRNILYIFVIACVISGCSNSYIELYEQEISDSDSESLKKSHPDYFLPYNEFSISIYEVDLDAAGAEVNEAGAEPEAAGAQVLAAANIAIAELESRGCIYLGFSKFYGRMEATSEIVKAAKEIGATAALYATKYRGKQTGIMPVTNYSRTRGNISGSVSGTDYSRNYTGNYSETTSYTSYVPYEYDTYYQFAAFFINCK